METQTPSVLRPVIRRLHDAQNRHDLEAFLACFDPDFLSEQPIHPDRTFRGREQVRKNWSTMFSNILDFQSDLLRTASSGDVEWTEWRWYGTRADGTRLDLRAVTIYGVQDDRIIWGRLYMEPVQEMGEGIDASVKDLHQRSD